MSTYYTVEFDHFESALTMYKDLRMLQVPSVSLHTITRHDKWDGGVVWVKMPETSTDHDALQRAVNAVAQGRGPHAQPRRQVISSEGITADELSALIDGHPWGSER